MGHKMCVYDSPPPLWRGGDKQRIECLPDRYELVLEPATMDAADLAELEEVLGWWQRSHDWFVRLETQIEFDLINYEIEPTAGELLLLAQRRDNVRWCQWSFYRRLHAITGWWPEHARVTGGVS